MRVLLISLQVLQNHARLSRFLEIMKINKIKVQNITDVDIKLSK